MKPETALYSPENAVLTAKQEAAALSLAAGGTQEQASKQSGAGTRTIKTWLATLPTFKSRIQELRAEMTSRALGRLVENMVSAADTLGYLCRKSKSETVRLNAARAVLEMSTKLRESVELEQRISELESAQPQQQKARLA
jgi:hypothetical protein